MAGAWHWLHTPSCVEVKERVELYLCSPSVPSWPVLEWTLPLCHLQWVIPRTRSDITNWDGDEPEDMEKNHWMRIWHFLQWIEWRENLVCFWISWRKCHELYLGEISVDKYNLLLLRSVVWFVICVLVGKHAESWAVWGPRQRLHDCGPRFAVRVGRGAGWPHRETCDKLKHNAAAVPVHAGPHAWGAPEFFCTAWWPN